MSGTRGRGKGDNDEDVYDQEYEYDEKIGSDREMEHRHHDYYDTRGYYDYYTDHDDNSRRGSNFKRDIEDNKGKRDKDEFKKTSENESYSDIFGEDHGSKADKNHKREEKELTKEEMERIQIDQLLTKTKNESPNRHLWGKWKGKNISGWDRINEYMYGR